MKYQIHAAKTLDKKTDCLVVAVWEKSGPATSTLLDDTLAAVASSVFKAGDIKGKAGETLLVPVSSHGKTERLLLVGAGDAAKFDAKAYRKLARAAMQALKKTAARSALFTLPELTISNRDTAWAVTQLTLEAGNAYYSYDCTKSKKAEAATLKSISLSVPADASRKSLEEALRAGQAISLGMSTTRELGNLPGNICTPSYLGEQATELAKRYSSVKVKVLGEKQMEKLGMGSLLSVGRGSEQESRLIVIEYKGAGKADSRPYCLVGKGITFDTGGISLKPGAGMDEMKFDMCGAASVIGTLTAVAELALPINVVAVIAAAENMPSSVATKPGDVVTSMSGKTIEILNTDAEGRLVLCDALTYTERFKPKAVIDIATLTGACVIALGNHATGLFSNNDDLADALLDAGKQTHDRAWHMPLWDDYQKQLDSNFADMANIGGREGGSITAACFLSRFAKKFPWAHLDIAGTAWKSGSAKGATGRPVPLLVQYLLNQA